MKQKKRNGQKPSQKSCVYTIYHFENENFSFMDHTCMCIFNDNFFFKYRNAEIKSNLKFAFILIFDLRSSGCLNTPPLSIEMGHFIVDVIGFDLDPFIVDVDDDDSVDLARCCC